MPTVKIDDFSTRMFGVGTKHGLNQWIPDGNLLPVDLSVQMGYTRLTSDMNYRVDPEVNSETYNPHPADTWDGQGIDFVATGFTGNLLVGKNLPVIALFAGVGFQSSSVSLKTNGSYPIVDFNPDYDPADTHEETRLMIVERLEEPVDTRIASESHMNALLGARIRLGFLAVSASYTLAKYSTANLGVGISFR